MFEFSSFEEYHQIQFPITTIFVQQIKSVDKPLVARSQMLIEVFQSLAANHPK